MANDNKAPDATVDELIRDLNDPNERTFTIVFLKGVAPKYKELTPLLVQILRDNDDALPFDSLVDAIAGMGPTAVPLLIGVLNHSHARVRKYSVMALGKSLHKAGKKAKKQVVPHLVPLLDDEDADVRRNACGALAECGSDAEAALPKLAKLLKHPNDGTRRSASYALSHIGPGAEKVLPDILAALHDRSIKDETVRWFFRYHLIETLESIGPAAKDAVPTLVGFVENQEEKLSAVSAHALRSIGVKSKKAISALRKALKRKDEHERLCVAFALASLDPKSELGVSALVSLVESKDELISRMAMMMLGKLGSLATPGLPVLKKKLRNKDAETREIAQEAIDRISERKK